MAASKATIAAIADAIEEYVPARNVQPFLGRLVTIRGNKSYADTVAALLYELAARARRRRT